MTTEELFTPEQYATWEDAITTGIELREQRDALSFGLGDLALEVCGGRNPEGGRPGHESHTLSEYARAICEDRSRLSGLVANSEFWPKSERADIPPNVSWYHLSEARRRSGWRPGNPITAEHKARAWNFVNEYASVEEYPPRPPDARPRWQRRLERAVSILAEIVDDPELPAPVRALVRLILAFEKHKDETNAR